MSWFLMALRKYATFSGRSRRKEYWFFFLFSVIFSILATLIDAMTGAFNTDRSGWWILICLIPIIGAIWLLVLLVLDSTPGNNRFGPNPKSDLAQLKEGSVEDGYGT